jgi:hypothetical protein
MNISKLKSLIKEEIKFLLEEEENLSAKEIESRAEATKNLNKELEKTVDLNNQLQKENEDEDEDKEPSLTQLKGASKDPISIISNKLQQISVELKSTANKWKSSEGEEKNKLRNKLLTLTNIKKELESMLE